MKKSIASTFTVLLVILLSACTTMGGGADNNSKTPENTVDEITDDGKLDEHIAAFPPQIDLTMPDGGTLKPSEATNGWVSEEDHNGDIVKYTCLIFDSAYLAYGDINYMDTNDTPDLIDWDKNPNWLADKYTSPFEALDYFKVVKGDVLRNGLTVTDVRTILVHESDDDQVWLKQSKIALTGEIEVNGLIYCFSGEDEDVKRNNIMFYLDKNNSNAMFPYNFDGWFFEPRINNCTDFAVATNSPQYIFNNAESFKTEIKDVLKDNLSAKVKMVLKNITLEYREEFSGRIFADIVSIKAI